MLGFKTIDYNINQKILKILDQTRLPNEEKYVEVDSKEELFECIKKLKVRGAPAIGVAAALGISSVMHKDALEKKKIDYQEFITMFDNVCEYIASSRPTAVNLFKSIERLKNIVSSIEDKDIGKTLNSIENEAIKIWNEDIEFCNNMAEHGLSLLDKEMGILTHCNAGALATAGKGTCLAPIYLGHERGYDFKVYADETRPLLQGARLTAWELNKSGIDVTLICDNMAATLMSKDKIDAVVVGCDRMAANGDGANKIGTLQVAIMAKYYNIPFYMFVPSSTIDMNIKSGLEINIEMRDNDEIKKMWYKEEMAPSDIDAFNPSFDVTDHNLITAIVTEKGIIRPPFDKNLKKIFG